MTQVISMAKIVEQASNAARIASKGQTVLCPYRESTEAQKLWQAAFEEFLLRGVKE